MQNFEEHSTPASRLTLSDFLSTASAKYGDRPFITFEKSQHEPVTITFDRFVMQARNMALWLRAEGVEIGTPILLHVDNSIEAFIAWFAIVLSGAICVSTNTKLTLSELTEHFDVIEPKFAITQPQYLSVVQDSLKPSRPIYLVDNETGELHPKLNSAMHVDELGSEMPEAIAACLFTSGTTSRPKAVGLTQANLCIGAYSAAENIGLVETDTNLVHLPFFHINALVYSMLASMAAGCKIVLTPKFSASTFWELSKKHRCTWAAMIAFTIKALKARPIPSEHHYRCWGWGLTDPQVDTHFGIRTISWYGMTETISHPIIGSLDSLKNIAGAMGFEAPGYRIDLVGADGLNVGDNMVGEIRIRGTRGLNLFHSYLNDDSATAAVFDDQGRFKTGDLALRTATGAFVYHGRIKDVIRVGAESVVPLEVESSLRKIAWIDDVAVVGLPDDLYGEVPVAFIMTSGERNDTQSDIRDIGIILAKSLAPHKHPRHFYFVRSLPRSMLEKVNKAALRAEASRLHSTATTEVL